jgi:hypothetical protein
MCKFLYRGVEVGKAVVSRSKFDKPSSPEMITVHSDDFKATLVDQLLDVLVPPASVTISMNGRKVVEDSIDPVVIASTVLEEENLSLSRLAHRSKILEKANWLGSRAEAKRLNDGVVAIWRTRDAL